MAPSAAERTRRKYKPDDIRVLFIGESPPAGGEFFYLANSALYYATRQAFETAIPALRKREDFVRAFCALGCYLARRPVTGAGQPSRPERPRATRRASGGTAEGHEGTQPSHAAVDSQGRRT